MVIPVIAGLVTGMLVVTSTIVVVGGGGVGTGMKNHFIYKSNVFSQSF